MHLYRYSATGIHIIPYRGRFCCSHPYKAGIAWERRPKTRKRHRMVVLDGVRQSLLGLDSREQQKVTQAAESRNIPHMRRLDGG